jgi:hypothetical protein
MRSFTELAFSAYLVFVDFRPQREEMGIGQNGIDQRNRVESRLRQNKETCEQRLRLCVVGARESVF